MVDRPIIFSAPMIRALLDGRKTMTRRLAWKLRACTDEHGEDAHRMVPSPWQRVTPGDRLWVREAHRYATGQVGDRAAVVRYAADNDCLAVTMLEPEATGPRGFNGRLRPSIHMPRWASRLTLHVEAVRIERLQDISVDDAIAEGIAGNPVQEGTWLSYPSGSSAAGWADPRESFRSLWTHLHGPGAWDRNPEAVALTFRVEKRNIDAQAAANA